MSDYLDHLANRTTGAGKDILVQPRLPSVYEPLPSTPDLAGQASPSAQTDKELQGSEPDPSTRISNSPKRLLGLAGRRAAVMSTSREQPFSTSAETDPPSARSSRRRVVQEAKAEGPVPVHHPPGLPSKADEAAKNDDLQQDPILWPPDRAPSAASAFPGADGSTERLPPLSRRSVTPQEGGSGRIDMRERHSPDLVAMSEAGESDLEETVESHLRDMSQSGRVKSREAEDQRRVKRDPYAPNIGPALPDKARVWKPASQGAIVPSNGGGFKAGQTGHGDKKGMPEPDTGSPVLSPRPSLRARESAPASPSPAGRRQRNGDAAAARATEREQSSVVRVTIGRIEVRAMMPVTFSEKDAPPKPRMSLEEYLRQQNEARR
jgi:hypothetical protein